MSQFLRLVDKYIYVLIWASIVGLFIELSTGSHNSKESGMATFLWIERFTAFVFILEYCFRIIEDIKNPDATIDIGHNIYVLSVMGIIDLVSWLPFAIGFFVPISILGWIRAFRILRILKLFRYSRTLQLFALAIYRAMWLLKAVGLTILCFGLLGGALIYEAEHLAQPDKFDGMFSTFYFMMTAATTVGFGDMYPITNAGRIVVMTCIYLPVIGSFAALIGSLGASFNEVMELERNPDVDPIEEFVKEKRSSFNRNS